MWCVRSPIEIIKESGGHLMILLRSGATIVAVIVVVTSEAWGKKAAVPLRSGKTKKVALVSCILQQHQQCQKCQTVKNKSDRQVCVHVCGSQTHYPVLFSIPPHHDVQESMLDR